MESGRRETSALVGHGNMQPSLFLPDRDPCLFSRRMFDDIHEQFPYRLEQQHGLVFRQGEVIRPEFQGHFEVPLYHLFRQPLQGHRQSELLQNRRAELRYRVRV
jgi:hypothetical protein